MHITIGDVRHALDKERTYQDTDIFAAVEACFNLGHRLHLYCDGSRTQIKTIPELWFACRAVGEYHNTIIYTEPCAFSQEMSRLWVSAVEHMLEESDEEEPECEDYEAEEFRPTGGKGKRYAWEAKHSKQRVRAE